MPRTGSGPAVRTLVFPLDNPHKCLGCDLKTKKALAGVEGVKEHFLDLEKKQLIVTGTGTMDRDTVVKKLSKLKRLHVRFADNDLNDQRPPMQPQGVDCNCCLPRHGPPMHPPPRSGQHGQPPLGLPHQPPHHEVHGCNNELPPPSSACHCPPPHYAHNGPPHGPVHLRINEPPQPQPYSACQCAPPPPHCGHGPPPPRMQLPHHNQPPPSSACHCPPPPEFNHAPLPQPGPMQLPHYNQPPPSSACHCPPPEHNHAPPPHRPQPPHHALSCHQAPNDAPAVFDNFFHGPASPLIPANVCPAGLVEKLANIGRIKQVDLINKKGIKLTFEDGHVTSYHPTSYMEIRPGYDCAAMPPPRYVSPFSDENPNGFCSIM
ncbi:hypothetical protein QQ045_028929 [Rhodiola kirilowii]